jgi:hypothetical protein
MLGQERDQFSVERWEPDARGFQPASHADITLRELTFQVIFGTEEETWRLDELTMENIAVGWFAG